MSDGRPGVGGIGTHRWRAIVRAGVVAAVAVSVGGVTAIVAISLGASGVTGLSLMAAIVLCGAGAAAFIVGRAGRGGRAPDPETLLEWQLSARYGVRVERVAWHVWRVDGELVEATLAPSGYLVSGGRELQL